MTQKHKTEVMEVRNDFLKFGLLFCGYRDLGTSKELSTDS